MTSNFPLPSPRLLDAGEGALVVEFGTVVDPDISDRVLALDIALNQLALAGVRETVPTYRSLMIHYDPLRLERADLIAAVKTIEAAPHARHIPANRWTIPCCYDVQHGEDLGQIAEMTGLSTERAISLHAGATYRVYMFGFAPGFCYLGGLPPELAVSRRATPRPPTPPNVVTIGGGLALVTTVSMPTGWWLIGRTPERIFSPAREPNFLVAVGDALRFEPIDRTTFDSLETRAAAGEIVARRERLA
ncbi:MAG: allophanate hydrolase subunit 1 [Alphaproteobacteria bacterium]|nr:allophanate hydrolase subunit 1 [Alphaproteobacteria bacterium]